jgi:hypothetical protein
MGGAGHRDVEQPPSSRPATSRPEREPTIAQVMGEPMSEVQALLSVDAGKIPPGVVAFFPRDAEAPARRMRAGLAVIVEAAAVTLALVGTARPLVALLALAGVALTVGAFPTKPDEDEPPSKRATLVLTPTGMILRDASGLQTWRYEDLLHVSPFVHELTLGLLVIRRNGRREFLDTASFERGEKVRELLGRRIPRRTFDVPAT